MHTGNMPYRMVRFGYRGRERRSYMKVEMRANNADAVVTAAAREPTNLRAEKWNTEAERWEPIGFASSPDPEVAYIDGPGAAFI